MAKIALLNIKGEKLKDITLDDKIWKIDPNDAVIFDALRLKMASRRQGTSATKSRGMVRGSTRKILRQKGTGNARQGSNRAPHRTGGGVAFAKVTRDYTFKMNRKEKKLALRSAVAYKIIEKKIVLLDSLKLEAPKTKEILGILNNLKVNEKTLIVTPILEENLLLATSNLRNIMICLPTEINTYDIVNSGKVIVLEEAIEMIEEVLS